MKKAITLTIILIFSMAVLSACSGSKPTNNITQKDSISSTEKEQNIREITYNQLTSEDKERIKGTWQDSSFPKIILKGQYSRDIVDKSYIGKEVYFIDFKLQ